MKPLPFNGQHEDDFCNCFNQLQRRKLLNSAADVGSRVLVLNADKERNFQFVHVIKRKWGRFVAVGRYSHPTASQVVRLWLLNG